MSTNPALHIVICFHDFSRGGTERIALGLAKGWVDAGCKVTMLAGTEEGGLRDTVDPRIAVDVLHPQIKRSFFSRFRLGKAMAQRMPALNADIIFLPGNFHLQLALEFAKVPNLPPLVTKISNPAVPKGVFAKPLRWLIIHYNHCVDGVAAMNSGLTRDLLAMLPDLQVRTLYDPVYIDHKDVIARRAESGETLNILWAGRLEPQKDVLLALKTIATLNKFCAAKLIILGDGSQREVVQQQIMSMGLDSSVSTPGHVSKIDPYLANADALLITSHFEGGPAVAVEALAHGVRVVSTDCSYFLHDIMTRPEAGKIISSRAPEDLAAALFAITKTSPPPVENLAGLVAHLEPEPCSQAYLDWFRHIIATRAS